MAAIKTGFTTPGTWEGCKQVRVFVAASHANRLFVDVFNSFSITDISIFIVCLNFFEWEGNVIREKLFARKKLLQIRVEREVRIQRRMGNVRKNGDWERILFLRD